ncbi:hypothetical protein MMC30_006098 [Trapelia coarctata]|nr:hypothetical protein [Trapelia coarctata]
MVLVANALLLLLSFPLIINGVAIPIRNQKSVSSSNGGIIVPGDLAQPIMQPDTRDTIPAMELPVLSANITQDQGGVSKSVRKPESENDPLAVQPSETDNSQTGMPSAEPRDQTLEETSNTSPEILEAKPRNKQAAMTDGSDGLDLARESGNVAEAKSRISRRAEKPIVADKKAISSTTTRKSTSTSTKRIHRATTASTTKSTSSTTSPTYSASPSPTATYKPGTCSFHVRQTYFPTCMHFNHHDCTRINSTVHLYDSACTLLTTANTTLTYDGQNKFSLSSALPYPLAFTQLGITQGSNQAMNSKNRKNYWPMLIAYAGAEGGKGKEWRNDDEGMCKWGEWEGFLVNRDFDCWFAC